MLNKSNIRLRPSYGGTFRFKNTKLYDFENF